MSRPFPLSSEAFESAKYVFQRLTGGNMDNKQAAHEALVVIDFGVSMLPGTSPPIHLAEPNPEQQLQDHLQAFINTGGNHASMQAAAIDWKKLIGLLIQVIGPWLLA